MEFSSLKSFKVLCGHLSLYLHQCLILSRIRPSTMAVYSQLYIYTAATRDRHVTGRASAESRIAPFTATN
jgi:hypothetical protein